MNEDWQRSIDLLNATHSFPCPVMIKAIGPNQELFIEAVVQVIRDTLSLSFDPPIRKREAKHGRHVSVTIEPTFDNAEEVLAVYANLRAVDDIIMVL